MYLRSGGLQEKSGMDKKQVTIAESLERIAGELNVV